MSRASSTIRMWGLTSSRTISSFLAQTMLDPSVVSQMQLVANLRKMGGRRPLRPFRRLGTNPRDMTQLGYRETGFRGEFPCIHTFVTHVWPGQLLPLQLALPAPHFRHRGPPLTGQISKRPRRPIGAVGAAFWRNTISTRTARLLATNST